MLIIKESSYQTKNNSELSSKKIADLMFNFDECQKDDACGCEDCNCDVISTL